MTGILTNGGFTNRVNYNILNTALERQKKLLKST